MLLQQFSKELPKESICPTGENSPNPVILVYQGKLSISVGILGFQTSVTIFWCNISILAPEKLLICRKHSCLFVPHEINSGFWRQDTQWIFIIEIYDLSRSI
jgi:hypothetical protein